MKYLQKELLISTLLYIIGVGIVRAQTQETRLSLMTCSPGTEVYSLYGHTAIRYQNALTDEDWVFNYGTFSFNTPHFIWRFTRGQTDYELGVVPFNVFVQEYERRGSSVTQQTLNLRPDETRKLINLLKNNCLPENCTYRYNYFYDNCTTRARDRIEEAIDGKVVYPDSISLDGIGLALPIARRPLSYRSITQQFTDGYVWAEFGNSLALGAEADRPIEPREQMFAPFYLLAYADSAKIKADDGTVRPLVAEKTVIVPLGTPPLQEDDFPLSPMLCACLLLALTIVVGLVEIKTGKLCWGYDLLFYTLQGVAGIIIAFLFFFSEHPTVGSNWLIIILNPLPLLCLPWIIYCVRKHKVCLYHKIALAVLVLFLLGWGVELIPQKFNLAVLPLALSLLVRTVNHLFWERKKCRINT